MAAKSRAAQMEVETAFATVAPSLELARTDRARCALERATSSDIQQWLGPLNYGWEPLPEAARDAAAYDMARTED